MASDPTSLSGIGHAITYGIALGSNLENRLEHLQKAILALQTIPTLTIRKVAALYESDPVDCPEGSAPFLNSVVEVTCQHAPVEMLRRTQHIQTTLGRNLSPIRNAPRTIDLDLLYADDLILDLPELTLPHPRMTQRRFVLQPLADIRPELILPGHQRTIATYLEMLESSEAPLRLLQQSWA